MVQVRKLVLAIAAASALSSGMAQALQLGEMTLKSKLNQPLSVEIELLDVGASRPPRSPRAWRRPRRLSMPASIARRSSMT